MIIILKRALYIALTIILLIFAGVGLQSYLDGVLEPPYDQDAITLNYERIGDGPDKIVLLHGLTGSLNYWKKGLGEVPDSHSWGTQWEQSWQSDSLQGTRTGLTGWPSSAFPIMPTRTQSEMDLRNYRCGTGFRWIPDSSSFASSTLFI